MRVSSAQMQWSASAMMPRRSCRASRKFWRMGLPSWSSQSAVDAKETCNNSLDPAPTRTIINPTEVFSKENSLVTQPTAAPPVRVEIYDQVYNLRGVDAEYIMKLAEFVDGKMRTVGEQTSTIDSLRLAVLAALNIADEYHILKKKYDLLAGEFNRRAGQLAGALDEVLQDERRAGW